MTSIHQFSRAAMKAAWAETKRGAGAPTNGALVLMRPTGSLAPLRRRLGRVWPLLASVARWIGSRFIPARAA
jgi:uncharacterized membrane protein